MLRIVKSGSIVLLVALFVLILGVAGLAEQKTVLVVGYGWYTGIPSGQINNAELVLHALAGEEIHGAIVQSVINPVTWDGAIPPIIEAIKQFDPVLIVGLGTSGGATALRLEQYGGNNSYGKDSSFPERVMRGKEVDDQRVYEPIDPDGPAFEEAIVPLPLEDVASAIRDEGIPAIVGSKYNKEGYPETMWFSTAGSYLCNWEAYSMPHYIRNEGLDTYFVFTHIPTQPKYRAMDIKPGDTEQPGPSMSLDLTIQGIRKTIETILEAME